MAWLLWLLTERAIGKRRFLPLMEPPALESHDEVGVVLDFICSAFEATTSSSLIRRLDSEVTEP